ncbi:hypothetical protein JCM10207_001568 [Rhodosporidiobolus poonsookiae]
MSTRTRQPRKVASNVTYSNPPEYEGIDSDEDASEEEEEWGGKRTRKGKGKAKQQRTSRRGDSSAEDDDNAKPARKKRRATKGPRKGNKGKLAMVQALPVELLLEIFSHLGPKELLALSNTSKTYHTLLAAPGSTSLWKAAREPFKLPDLEIDNLTELQYAQLVFGTKCQVCGTKRVKHADWFLLRRICVDCRKEKLVHLDQLKRDRKDLHSLARDCVLQTYALGLVQDLEYYSNILWDLEHVPDAASKQLAAASSAPLPAAERRSARSARLSVPSTVDYVEMSDSEDEGLSKFRSTRAVQDFVEARRSALTALDQEASRGRKAAEYAYELAALPEDEQPELRDWDAWTVRSQRQQDILAKMRTIDPDFSVADYSWSPWRYSRVINKAEALTDEIWERIAPHVLKVAFREQEYVAIEERVGLQKWRQRRLHRRYEKLKDALDSSAKPFLPLFVDFLLLPSVRPLWEDLDAELDDDTYRDAFDDIVEDIEQYRLELCLHARACILAATRDDEDDPPSDEDVDSADLSDAFFERPASFLACTFPNCPDAIYYARQRASYGSPTFLNPQYDRCAGVGPLVELLQHQHDVHNNRRQLVFSWTRRKWPDLEWRVNLPPEVACGVSALMEVGRIDPKTATWRELTVMCCEGKLVWENAPVKEKKFRGPRAWRNLLGRIKRSVTTFERSKTPRTLDPPRIAYYPDPPAKPRGKDD